MPRWLRLLATEKEATGHKNPGRRTVRDIVVLFVRINTCRPCRLHWLRQLRGCPPYRDLLTVTFHGREEERVWQAALAFRARLDGLLHSEFYRGETAAVLGPAPASVARINYHYRCRLTLSCVNTRRLRELLAFLVREFAKDRSFRGVGAFVDVNGRE